MNKSSWLLLGGGLANALLALRLEKISAEYLIVERGPRLLGGQTWSCQLSDVEAIDRSFLSSLADAQWPRYSVAFPDYERVIESHYLTIRSEELRRRLDEMIPRRKILLNAQAQDVSQKDFDHVVSATGFSAAAQDCGFQKFVGWDLNFQRPHGILQPLLMDATVRQKDGYRFFYLLPFDERHLLVEETRYSNFPEVDQVDFSDGLNEYLQDRFAGHTWTRMREESGSLPIPWKMNPPVGKFGVEGGYFHPSSGYSLPCAVRTSRQLVEHVSSGHEISEALAKIGKAQAKDRAYYLMLNRMMFLASPPLERRKIFERFYRLDEALIRRFYSGHPTAIDKIRMLTGKPPVKIADAWRVLSKREGRPVWN
jgi:lycopene beta-cyclase